MAFGRAAGAAGAAGAIGDGGWPIVEKLLTDSDANVAAAALGALRAMPNVEGADDAIDLAEPGSEGAALTRLRDELDLAVLLITHDLGVIAETCDRVVVMYCGEVVEEAPVEELFASPAHPYTRGLLAALPRLGEPAPRGELPAIPGQVPEASALPPGCPFHPRCGDVMEVCATSRPPSYEVGAGRAARCFLHRREQP